MAVSVDAPDKSEALRVHLSLPFPILCDTERRVVRDWGIYNSREKGGIAKPAVFIIDPSQVVRYAAVDTVVRRVPAAEIVSLLQNAARSAAGSTQSSRPAVFRVDKRDSEYHSAVSGATCSAESRRSEITPLAVRPDFWRLNRLIRHRRPDGSEPLFA